MWSLLCNQRNRTMTIPLDGAYASQLDAQDPLAHFRERFIITDPALIYMDGNSLGRLPKTSMPLAEDLIQQQWGNRLIRSWNEGWFTAPERVGEKIARLIGDRKSTRLNSSHDQIS